MRHLKGIWLNVLVALIVALPAFGAIPNIAGFISQVDGDDITAGEWNTFVGGIYSYINTNLVPALNTLTTKGDVFSHNGSALVRVGVGTNGQVLTADSAQTAGIKWASIANVTNLTTKGDLLGFDVALARIPVGTDGQVLTADSTQAAGVRWATSTTGVPAGTIVLWSGSLGSIPSGWALCDGQNGRPNLQGVFVLGAGNVSPGASGGLGLKNPGNTGGSQTHAHFIVAGGTGSSIGSGGPLVLSDARPHIPPYHSLAYIIKL